MVFATVPTMRKDDPKTVEYETKAIREVLA